jgi:predicted aspartyl protease
VFEMKGSVDGRGRPLLRLTVVGTSDEILATIDTGFNGELLVSQSDANALGIATSGVFEDMVLGDGSEIEARKGRATIMWFGAPRSVAVFLTAETDVSRPVADEPVALIGTRLLADDILEINFPAKTVVISQAV